MLGTRYEESDLDGIDWFEFERLCEDMIAERGYEIVDKVGDNGIDILATSSDGSFALFQAKHHSKPVGPDVVREMVGTRERFLAINQALKKSDVAATIMSSSGFTESAKSDAGTLGILLVTVG